jgi:hypothetical protein
MQTKCNEHLRTCDILRQLADQVNASRLLLKSHLDKKARATNFKVYAGVSALYSLCLATLAGVHAAFSDIRADCALRRF